MVRTGRYTDTRSRSISQVRCLGLGLLLDRQGPGSWHMPASRILGLAGGWRQLWQRLVHVQIEAPFCKSAKGAAQIMHPDLADACLRKNGQKILMVKIVRILYSLRPPQNRGIRRG